jgi:hypothetical protein
MKYIFIYRSITGTGMDVRERMGADVRKRKVGIDEMGNTVTLIKCIHSIHVSTDVL